LNIRYGKTIRFYSYLTALATPLRAENRTGSPAPAPAAGWHLVWSDEFNQPEGSAPDPARWNYDTGGSGWGNDEQESHTSRTNKDCGSNAKGISA